MWVLRLHSALTPFCSTLHGQPFINHVELQILEKVSLSTLANDQSSFLKEVMTKDEVSDNIHHLPKDKS